MEIFDFFDKTYRISSQARLELKNIMKEQLYDKNAVVQDIGNTCQPLD